MAMSRKHYRAVAKILNDRRKEATDEEAAVIDAIARDMADVFHEDNERFRRYTFLIAAGAAP
jgi:hypothetical protein